MAKGGFPSNLGVISGMDHLRLALRLKGDYTFFYMQPHFRVEPRVAIKIPKMRLKVAMKLLSIFAIEAQG